MRTFGIIPVKSESIRFPDKNFSDFNGKPLIVNTLEKMIEYIDSIFISTDNPSRVKEILDIHNIRVNKPILDSKIENGVYIILRSKDLCKPETPTDDVIYDLIKRIDLKEDYIIVLCQVTSPNLKPYTLKHALEECSSFPDETIISVSPDYKPNGCFYIFTKYKFLRYQHIYAPNLYLVVLDWEQSADIDYAYQLFIAEAIKEGNYNYQIKR